MISIRLKLINFYDLIVNQLAMQFLIKALRFRISNSLISSIAEMIH